MSVCVAVRSFGVLVSTLKDRVAGRISIGVTTTDHPTLFTQEEEALLVEYIKAMADVCYGYTWLEVVPLASDYAHDTGKKDEDSRISQGWYYHSLKRWPELNAIKPSSLSVARKSCFSGLCIQLFH